MVIVALLAPAIANANGRPPMTNGVHFKPGDNHAIYVASTFGLLVSPDGCHFYWVCENNLGYGGEFDPAYAVTPTGAILASTFHGLRVSHDGGCSFVTTTAQLPPSDPGNISNLSPTRSRSGRPATSGSEPPRLVPATPCFDQPTMQHRSLHADRCRRRCGFRASRLRPAIRCAFT